MEKPEGSEQNEPSQKRPSARRVTSEDERSAASDSDRRAAGGAEADAAADASGNKGVKRVHARRPTAGTSAEAERASRATDAESGAARGEADPAAHDLARDVRHEATEWRKPGDREPPRKDRRPPTEPMWRAGAVATGGSDLAASGPRELARFEPEDDFGLDTDYESKVLPWLERLCKKYVRVELHGVHNVPAEGRALLVANHSRSPLWDGIILRTALRLQRERDGTSRKPRWLVDDHQYHAPFLGTFVSRLGAVRACQENAERLLSREELVVVFPEGAKAAERRYEDRHRLLRFGRGGYVKLALRTGTPVIPVAIVACEHERSAWQSRLGRVARMLRAPLLALGAQWPRLGFLGVPPIASRIRISIGEPVREIARQDALATRDDGLVHELNECVRGAVQQLVNTALQA